MLIRPTSDQTFECITQEHHAVVSGMLAAAWSPSRLDPLWVQAIGVHDNPWRAADAEPLFNAERGLPHDFITYPMDDKLRLYREGLDALEDAHPFIAHLVSRHYTTFSGTRDLDELNRPEDERRARLERVITPHRLEESDEALEWMKFFDVFSLHLCLTGPQAKPGSIPRWLTDSDKWSTAPDGTKLELRWQDDRRLSVDPWPFGGQEMACELYVRELGTRFDDARTMRQAWDEAEVVKRELTLAASESSGAS